MLLKMITIRVNGQSIIIIVYGCVEKADIIRWSEEVAWIIPSRCTPLRGYCTR